jgi:Tol biopolymer transport system component
MAYGVRDGVALQGGGIWRRLLLWGLLSAIVGWIQGDREDHRGIDFDASPVSDQIVFTGVGEGERDLYLLDLVSLQAKQIARTPEYERNPAFSPDGRSVVYSASVKLPGPAHLFVRSLDGSPPVQLTPDEPFYDSMPAFSPDGSQIVFARAHRLRPYSMGGYTWDDEDVYLMNADGTDLRRITKGKYHRLTRPQFGGDGTAVIFSSYHRGHGRSTLYTVPVSGDEPPERLDTEEHSSQPAVSRDGQQIVFLSDRAKAYDYDLYLMGLDGSNLRRLTDNKAYNSHPVFSRDGQRVFFLSLADDGFVFRYALWEVEINSLRLKQIADPSLFDDPLQWSANSARPVQAHGGEAR